MNSVLFAEISVGDSAEFTRKFAESDVRAFAALSGDANPLHVDAAYASQTAYGRCIVHGMLVASLFSQMVGVHLPGRYCLYLSQDVVFRRPVFAGDTVTVKGKVVQKSEGTRIVEVAVSAFVDGNVVADGTARVRMLR